MNPLASPPYRRVIGPPRGSSGTGVVVVPHSAGGGYVNGGSNEVS